ncbi:GBS Bsp-like repeat-containing protein [Streptococcus hyovaginalis]|uniref:GBS Bsp-like repeat-containing protein n=1 Tax=Streptococcus hyovaginalis TaxID=149015 RepID=UPI002A8092EB|nr:GBS Bsp-like repeat-containing protein [Streptococcus hyovaginalis]MDY4511211.1 GBS Bsp-like repeat-containing protein [Streptococcus hyovaginalis]
MKWHQTQRFSIRKYSFGAASVLLATVSFMTGQTASADETTPVDSLSTLTANNSAEPTSQVVSTGTPASPAQTTVAQSVPADTVSPEAPAVTKTNQVSSAPTVAPSSQATVAAETSQAKATPVQAQVSTNQPSATTSTGSPVTSETVRTSSTQSLGETRAAAAAGPVSNPAPNVAPSGSYVFTEPTGVKSEPKLSSPDLAQYQKGQTVNYDSVVNADQHKWLSYVSYGGARRYVSIGSIAPTPTPVPVASTTSRSASTAKSASQGNYDVFNRIVYLDAGHGGTDPGAVYFGTHEKALNLEIQKRVKSKLEAQGFRVELTRSSDTGLDLLPRSEKANKTSSDIFVSIHFNAASTPSVNGIETYYYQSYAEYPARVNAQYHNNAQRLNLSASLASSIQSKLIANTGARNAGVKRQTFAVLRETTAPAVLLELGYMSNSAEFAKISSAAYQEKLATGIVQGIADYYKKHASLPATSVVTKPAPAAPVKTTIVAKGSTGFDVTITNVPAVMTSVRVPVWSDKSGQDDIKWYTAQSKGNGTYTLSVSTANHNFDLGKYNVHVYGQNSQTGKLEGLTATTVTLVAPAPKPTEATPSPTPAKIVTTAVAKGSTGFDVTITNVPAVMTSVRVPVWSDKSGQDDIKWYTAQSKGNGTYTLSVSTANHNFEVGKYNVHVYGQNSQTGKLEGLQATAVTLAAPTTTPAASVKTTVVAKDSTGFDVTITNVPAVMTSVRVPVWSDKSGQDDIKWYTAQSRGNGTYTLSVSTANHNFEVGKYNIHVYGQNSQKGKLEGLQATAVTLVSSAQNQSKPEASAKVDIKTSYRGTGVYGVDVTNVTNKGDVLFAVWSNTNGQDDLKWYPTKQISPSVYTATFDTKTHKNTGTYHIHVYQKIDGKMVGIGAVTQNVTKNTFNLPTKRQGDPRWGGLVYGRGNLAMTGCVPTALSMVYSALTSTDVSPVTVANYLYHNTNHFNKNFLGTSSLGIFSANQKWGLKSNTLNTQNDLATTLKEGHYVVAAVQGNKFVASSNPAVSHEIVLHGYKDGSTLVTDPFTGRTEWYSISRLFNEASRDKDDTAHKGKPFIKITDHF